MKMPRFLRFLTTVATAFPLILALTATQTAQAAGAQEDPLERRLRLNLWGAGLKDVAIAVKEATGADIVFYLPDLPMEENTDNVHLVTGEVTLGTVLETLARRFGFRFRVAETEQGSRIELSRSYGWVPAEPTLRFARLPRLAGPDSTPEQEGKFLNELLKPLPLLTGEFTARVEPYPLPGDPYALRATAVLPKEMADIFVKSIACLSGDSGDFPPRVEPGGDFDRNTLIDLPPRAPRENAPEARARGESPPDWEALLTRPVHNPRRTDLRALLADIAAQTNTAIALRAPPAEERGALPGDIFRYTLGRICEILSTDFALGKRVFLAGGGVVFERGKEPAMETDPRSRELFWSGLATAGFDAGAAVRRAGGAEALLARIRREISPGIWRDPMTSLLYSPQTNRFAVTAPYNTIEKIAALLTADRW